jgi:hypothetical protein
MHAVNTNRDLYKSIEGLLKQKQGQPVPSLEVYLSALIRRASRLAHKESMGLEEFFSLLRDAFDGPAEALPYNSTPAFDKWKVQVEQQIEDLRQMARSGQLQDGHRYFGISAPSGRQWYNFDPCAYIECGAAGSLGGWVEGDETGRAYVPGQVACVSPDGGVESCDPRGLDRPPAEVPEVTWEMFSDFAWCGQNFE